MPAPALVLFDIDGTLLRRAGPHHKNCLVDAIRGVTGVDVSIDGVATAGMLDRDILAAMLRAAGATPAVIKRHMPALIRRAQWLYSRGCPRLESALCPGVPDTLRALHNRGIVAGLVTGNLSRIGWKKMQNAGLRRYFRFGAFAEMADTRAGLVRAAVQHARRAGWVDGKTPVTLIGDHPNDVAAAKLNRVRSIAVGTGVVPEAEVRAAGPDLFLPDLRSFRTDMVL